MKLRTQLTIVITAFVAVFVAAAGLVVVLRDDHRDRTTVDRQLDAEAAAIVAASGKTGALPEDPTYAIRLIDNGGVRSATGPKVEFPVPSQDGLTNVRANGSDWRSVVTPLKTGARLQILLSLDDVQDRHDSNVLVVDLMIALAALLTAAGVWWLTGRLPTASAPTATPAATALPAAGVPAAGVPAAGVPAVPEQAVPEQAAVARRSAKVGADRLPAFAAALKGLGPGERLPGSTEPADVAALVNGLLDRAETPALPLDQLRSELEKLLDNPEMPATQRHLIMAAMLDTLNGR